jgi:chromate transporter
MRMELVSKLFRIFLVFLRISPLTFGGGYAMLPAIQREVVEKKRWMSDGDMSELLAISGAAPGGVGVNVSALVGYRLAGTWGAIAAVVGITLPTFVIVLLLSLAYAWLEHYPKMQAIMDGIHAAIIGLIAAAAYKMAKSSVFDFMTFLTAVGTVAVMVFIPVSPLVLLALGLLAGIIATYLKQKWGMKNPLSHNEQVEPKSTDNKAVDYFMADGI